MMSTVAITYITLLGFEDFCVPDEEEFVNDTGDLGTGLPFDDGGGFASPEDVSGGGATLVPGGCVTGKGGAAE